MIEAYRVVYEDGTAGFWHKASCPFIDFMVELAAQTDVFTVECQFFPTQDELDDANH